MMIIRRQTLLKLVQAVIGSLLGLALVFILRSVLAMRLATTGLGWDLHYFTLGAARHLAPEQHPRRDPSTSEVTSACQFPVTSRPTNPSPSPEVSLESIRTLQATATALASPGRAAGREVVKS